jgi:integrase
MRMSRDFASAQLRRYRDMAQRRGKGDGSLFFSESANRWLGFVDVGYDSAGKRRRVKVTGRTRAEARARLAEVRRAQDAGTPLGDNRTTVADWLDVWLSQLPATVRSVNTVDNIKWVVEHHLKPSIGRRRLRDLTPDDVDAMLRARATAGLARSTLVRIHNVLARALRHAERRGAVARNVASLVDVPSGATRKARSLTVAQAKRLLKAAEGDRLEALYKTGLMLGLRPGELLALQWSDVGFKNQVLHVRHALKRERGVLRIDDTKTEQSRRALVMPTPVVDALRAHRISQAAEKLQAPVWHDDNLVFATASGTLLDPSNLRRGFSRLTQAADIGHWHPHELRHSAASILSASGVPIEQIADVLGHAGTRTTVAVYRHLIEPTVRGAAGPMDALFGDGDDLELSAPSE